MKAAELGMGRNWPNEVTPGASAVTTWSSGAGMLFKLSKIEACRVGSYIPAAPS